MPRNTEGSSQVRSSPYFQLYLVSPDSAREREAGDVFVVVKNAPIRAAAGLLESLYVPVGRLGSGDESYLMFDDEPSFNAARNFAQQLDLPLIENPPENAGVEQSWPVGIGLYYALLSKPAAARDDVAEACVKRLREAAQSGPKSDEQPWAALMLAARVASDFQFDAEASIDLARQAVDASAEGSIERMTARWWVGQTQIQQGATAEARRTFKDLLAHEPTQAHAQAARRARQWLDQHGG